MKGQFNNNIKINSNLITNGTLADQITGLDLIGA
jgi:hypothetical protein